MTNRIAAVCYRQSDGVIEFLLVRSSGGRWTIPRGGVHPGEASWEAAEREAFESAGATGRASRQPFTTIPVDARPGVDAYLLQVERRQRPMKRSREPTWFPSDEADRVLAADRRPDESAELRRLLREACRAIADGPVPA